MVGQLSLYDAGLWTGRDKPMSIHDKTMQRCANPVPTLGSRERRARVLVLGRYMYRSDRPEDGTCCILRRDDVHWLARAGACRADRCGEPGGLCDVLSGEKGHRS